jgi:hypothetical protein
MGHLISSINAEAAERMNTGSAERPDLPKPGTVVEYTMRPGHGRMGRSKFPAFVMGSNPHGRGIDLLVFIDSGDMIDEQMVEKAGPGTEFHCWDWLDDASAALRGVRGTIAALHQRVGEHEDRLKSLEAVVLGDFQPPKVSIIHIMQDFENRLREVARPFGDLAVPVPKRAAPAKAPKKRAAKKRAAKKRK